jgi:hypothetical protein
MSRPILWLIIAALLWAGIAELLDALGVLP